MAQIDIKNCFLRACDGRRATLTPASVPANSKLTFTDANQHHGTQWQVYDQVTVSLVAAGGTVPLTVVTVSTPGSKSVTINLATTSGTQTSTANQIIAAIVASPAASALITVANAGGSTGAGITDPAAAAVLTNGARALTAKIGDGNLVWDEKVNRVYFKDRGVLDAVRNGDESPMDLKWAFAYEFLQAVSSPQAVVQSANIAPWVLASGQTLVVTFDAGGAQTFTFTGTSGTLTGGSPTLPPAAFSTLILAIDNGASQTVTFVGNESSPTLIAQQINYTLAGAVASVSGGNIILTSKSGGTNSKVNITGGTALSALGLSVTSNTGSGNVANIFAVTFTDLYSIMAGLTNGTVSNDGVGHILLASATMGAGSTAQVMPTSTALGFGFNTEQQTSGVPTIEDVLEQRGNASVWVTTSPDTCEPYCIDLELEYNAPCTPVRKEFAVFPMFRFESLDHDPKSSQVSVSGKCNVTQAIISEY